MTFHTTCQTNCQMTSHETSSEGRVDGVLMRPMKLVCFSLAIAQLVFLAVCYTAGLWVAGPDGRGIATDFVNVWAAGHLAIMGHAAAAYDWPTHKLMEEAAVGHSFVGYFGWHYPPMFFFAAAALALMPYTVAYIVWVVGTFPAYLAAMRAIIGHRIGYLLAAAFPAVLLNFIAGQNGFLSAGLIGGTLILLDRRPIMAGVLLGLLAYKPQFGLLFPIALAAGGYWRTFITAGLVTALIAAASFLAFGGASWAAFWANIGHTSQAVLSEGEADWDKLQTAFGLIRALGGGAALAWTVQIALSILAAGVVTALWRSSTRFEIKAGSLATAALLATPYLYIYDLVALAVPLAFLIRAGAQRGFLSHEGAGIGLACLLIVIFPLVKAPVGFVAVLIVAALIARRAFAEWRRDAPQYLLGANP
jgi:arabinofuranan 3-O-arabinosyltransferase